MSDLVIDFIGERHDLTPDDDLVFGREADLVIDDNRYLHRRLGHVYWSGTAWWLRNVGDRIVMEVRDTDSRSVMVVSAGKEVALTFERSLIQFEAGGSNYELEVRLDIEPESGEPAAIELSDEGVEDGMTLGLDQLPMTDDQKRLLLVLCEAPLRNPSDDLGIPANKVAARRLGWTLKAYGRKLDNVCDRLTRTGVRGLRGDQAGVAADRRFMLAEYALSAGLVTADDLPLLPDVPTPELQSLAQQPAR